MGLGRGGAGHGGVPSRCNRPCNHAPPTNLLNPDPPPHPHPPKGGTLDFSFNDPLWESFKGAAAAGVVVSAAAGNEGEDMFGSTVPSSANDNGCPWVITVAAGTHPRRMFGEFTINSTATGARTFRGVPGKSNVPAGPAGVFFGGNDTYKALCYAGKLDPSEVAGKIVVCRRGDNGLFEKAGEVKRAGGVAMILLNTPTSK
jgi:subtilisin family serine protease